MKKIELHKVHDGYEVVEDDKPVGRVTQSSSGYGWQSYLAKPPYHQGRCSHEAGALAHLGYKKIKEKTHDSM